MKIEVMRKRAGLTKAELARRMGVSAPTVCRWESGTDVPCADRLPKLADVLQCSIDELFGRSPPGGKSA